MLTDDEAQYDDEGQAHADVRPIDKFHRTPAGLVFMAGMLGLRDVLMPERDEEPAIVEDWAGQPVDDDPYILRLDPEHPEDSIVMIRPWLRHPSQTTE